MVLKIFNFLFFFTRKSKERLVLFSAEDVFGLYVQILT